jgi:hypothetical protein
MMGEIITELQNIKKQVFATIYSKCHLITRKCHPRRYLKCRLNNSEQRIYPPLLQ